MRGWRKKGGLIVPHSAEELKAIGHLCVQWAFLETYLDATIASWQKLRPKSHHVNIRGLSFRQRAKLWAEIVNELFGAQTELGHSLKALMRDAILLRDNRDILLHGLSGKAPGKAGIKSSLLKFGTTDMKVHEKQFSADKIRELAHKISFVTANLQNFWTAWAEHSSSPGRGAEQHV